MSSPLDHRIRAVAREEAAGMIGADPDRVAALEAAVTSLHGTLLRLENRIDTLEKTAGQADQETRPVARRPRKAAGE